LQDIRVADWVHFFDPVVVERLREGYQRRMPRPPKSHPFDALAAQFAKVVADRLSPLLAPRRGPGRPKGSGRRGPAPGLKRDMRCRYPGCKNKSKGPRFRFLCEEHLKLPKSEQNAALEKWAGKTR
jgi:hypothetical protein